MRLIFAFFAMLLPMAASAAGDAEKFVTDLSDRVFAIVNDANASDSDKEKKLADVVRKDVDTDWMAMFVAGKYAKDLTAEQKKHYLKLYHDYLIYAYVPRFKEYSGADYAIQRVQESGKQVTVKVKIKGVKGKPDVLAEYRLSKSASGYKVVDLSGESVSMINTQRTDFGGIIAREGWEAFLTKMGAKVDKLKAEKGVL